MTVVMGGLIVEGRERGREPWGCLGKECSRQRDKGPVARMHLRGTRKPVEATEWAWVLGDTEAGRHRATLAMARTWSTPPSDALIGSWLQAIHDSCCSYYPFNTLINRFIAKTVIYFITEKINTKKGTGLGPGPPDSWSRMLSFTYLL